MVLEYTVRRLVSSVVSLLKRFIPVPWLRPLIRLEIRLQPAMKLNPCDPRPQHGVDQTEVFVKLGSDPSMAGKLIFASGAKASPPKGFGGLSLTSLTDLPVASIEPFATEAALVQAFASRAAHITPFALCDAAECAIFVECDTDPSKGSGFFFLEQRAAAIAGYSVPYRMLPALAEQVLQASATKVDLSKCVWLHSTGRCGSTLLSKIFDALGGVQSLSEPDVFTHLPIILNHAEAQGVDRAPALVPVVRACTQLLLHAQLARRPSEAVVLVKTRAFVVHAHALLRRALPEMRAVFLYRNAIETVDSKCMAFLQQPMMTFLRKHRLDGEMVPKMQQTLALNRPLAAPLAALYKAHRPLHLQLGAVGVMAQGWMSEMGAAQRLLAEGQLDCCLRYEDLVERKQALALAVLHELGLRPSGRRRASVTGELPADEDLADEDAVVAKWNDHPSLNDVFTTDAHQGANAHLASKRARDEKGRLLSEGPLYFPASEVADLVRFMQLHEVLGVTDPYCQLAKTVR